MIRKIYWNRISRLIPITILFFTLTLYFYNSVMFYLSAGRDDTFISLWSGISLAEGYGLVNYNFEPAEISSSLLHTLIIAFIHIIAPKFIYSINKTLGLLTGALLLILIYKNRHILFGRGVSAIVLLAISSLGLANNRSWLYWNLGGLETPFQSLLIFLYGLYLTKSWESSIKVLPLVILQVLYTLVRPEGFTIIFFTGIFLFLRSIKPRHQFHRKQILTLIGIPSSIFLSILIARYLSFGLFFPIPAYAKVNIGLDNDAITNIDEGIKYLAGFYTSSPYVVIQFIILIAFGILFAHTLINQRTKPNTDSFLIDSKLVLWFWLIVFNHLFVLGTGGDWMEFYRFIVPIVPFLTILTTCFAYRMALTSIENQVVSRSQYEIFTNFALGAIFLIAIATNSGQRDNYKEQVFHNCSGKIDLQNIQSLVMDYKNIDENLILMNCAGKRDWDGVMLFISDNLPIVYKSLNQNITIATFQMGLFPYYIKNIYPEMKIEFVDTLGLTDSNIARMKIPKKRFGVSDGTNIVKIFNGEADELSEYIINRKPNMIYVLNASNNRRRGLFELGWAIIWDQPGAVIFIQNSSIDRNP